jgi:membrane protease YdiL (CAAX protease family)
MPSRTALIANSLELGLVFAGLVVLWQLVLSPAARARRITSPSPLTSWEAPLSDFFLFLWVIICGGILLQVLATFLFKPLGLSEDGKLIFANAALELGMLGGIAFFRFGLRRGETIRPFAPALAWLSGFTTFLIAMPVVVVTGLVWQSLLKLCGLPVERQDMVGRLINAESPALLVGMVLLATVTAPITEELIFRAGFFRYARTRLPRWAALLVPACFFGALHQNLATFAPLVALGIVFSLAYERTGRIGTAMVAHGLFNAHTVALILIDPNAVN